MLKLVMRLNALSCAVFGGVFLVAAGATARFLGDPPVILVTLLGAALIVNAAHLVFEARKPVPSRATVLYFAAGDGIWVLGTLVLLATGLFITTQAGIWAAIAVAAMVGSFGLLQFLNAPNDAEMPRAQP